MILMYEYFTLPDTQSKVQYSSMTNILISMPPNCIQTIYLWEGNIVFYMIMNDKTTSITFWHIEMRKSEEIFQSWKINFCYVLCKSKWQKPVELCTWWTCNFIHQILLCYVDYIFRMNTFVESCVEKRPTSYLSRCYIYWGFIHVYDNINNNKSLFTEG